MGYRDRPGRSQEDLTARCISLFEVAPVFLLIGGHLPTHGSGQPIIAVHLSRQLSTLPHVEPTGFPYKLRSATGCVLVSVLNTVCQGSAMS